MMYRPSTHGFTLIETMVAIAVFMTAIVGPFLVAQKSVDAANTSRDEIIAGQLAQEGLEAIRYVRDSAYIANQSGWTPLANLDACRAPNYCMLDVTQSPDSAVKPCVSGVCTPFYLSTTGFYTYSSFNGSTVSKFTRAITITPSPGGQNAVERASSTVSWTGSGGTHSITVVEDFYDWF